MNSTTFHEIADLALRISGQALPPSKSYLVEARLSPIARREGFANLDDLAACLKARPNPVFEEEIAAALTGKETYFFRERDTLHRLVEDALPKVAAAGQSRIRIWCAGGGCGQEAYSLAMLLADEPPVALTDKKVEIVSTDLCKCATERGRSGGYGHFEVQRGLSIHRLLRHFKRLESGVWQISENLRRRVSFRAHNLMTEAGGLGEFDVVLCRNVLSTLTEPAQETAAKTLSRALAPNGVLMVGANERVPDKRASLIPAKYIRGAFRAAPPAATAAA